MKTLSKTSLSRRVAVIVGTRPGIIMFSPIIRALDERNVPFFIVHTGQHYSYNMDRILFEDLNLPEPTHHLDVASTGAKLHGEQTARMLEGCERVFLDEKPGLVLVGGDANTNLSGALAARKLGLQTGHVEAGERSFDWWMPEEHNRVMIDHISEHLFTTNEKGRDQLIKEQVKGAVYVTGNPIVDAAHQNLSIAQDQSDVLTRFDLQAQQYIVLTSHREENVDDKEKLLGIFEGAERVARKTNLEIVFSAHPRTIDRIERFGLADTVASVPGIRVIDAVGYLDFLKLLGNGAATITDSGGVQQESCILGVPCVTIRENTEWTETIDIGANRLAGTRPEAIEEAVVEALESNASWDIPFGSGDAAAKIAGIVEIAIQDSPGTDY